MNFILIEKKKKKKIYKLDANFWIISLLIYPKNKKSVWVIKIFIDNNNI